MGDVINIENKQIKKAEALGERTFLLCPCDATLPRGFVPVVLHHGGLPIVVALVCLNCDREVEIDCGQVVNP